MYSYGFILVHLHVCSLILVTSRSNYSNTPSKTLLILVSSQILIYRCIRSPLFSKTHTPHTPYYTLIHPHMTLHSLIDSLSHTHTLYYQLCYFRQYTEFLVLFSGYSRQTAVDFASLYIQCNRLRVIFLFVLNFKTVYLRSTQSCTLECGIFSMQTCF